MSDRIKEWDQYFGIHCHLPAAAIRDLFDALEAKDKRIAKLEAALARSCEDARNDMYDCGYNALKAENKRLRVALLDADDILKQGRDQIREALVAVQEDSDE